MLQLFILLDWIGNFIISVYPPYGGDIVYINISVYNGTTTLLENRRIYEYDSYIVYVPITSRLATPTSTLRIVVSFSPTTRNSSKNNATLTGGTYTGLLSSEAYITPGSINGDVRLSYPITNF